MRISLAKKKLFFKPRVVSECTNKTPIPSTPKISSLRGRMGCHLGGNMVTSKVEKGVDVRETYAQADIRNVFYYTAFQCDEILKKLITSFRNRFPFLHFSIIPPPQQCHVHWLQFLYLTNVVAYRGRITSLLNHKFYSWRSNANSL